MESPARRYGEELEKCLRRQDFKGADDTLRQFISRLRATNRSRRFEELIDGPKACQPVLPTSIRQRSPTFHYQTFLNWLQGIGLGLLGSVYISLHSALPQTTRNRCRLARPPREHRHHRFVHPSCSDRTHRVGGTPAAPETNESDL